MATGSDNKSPTSPNQTTTPITYVALGDSTGVGIGAREGGYVVRLFKKLESHRPGSQLVNLCVSGATTFEVINGQLDRGIKADPQFMTVGIGINDIGQGVPLQQFVANYEVILKRLTAETHAKIVVSNIPDISSSPIVLLAMRLKSQKTIELYNQRLAEIATAYRTVVFDIYSITHEELPNHPEYFSSDGFHPSDSGYQLWAYQMWPTIAQVIGNN